MPAYFHHPKPSYDTSLRLPTSPYVPYAHSTSHPRHQSVLIVFVLALLRFTFHALMDQLLGPSVPLHLPLHLPLPLQVTRPMMADRPHSVDRVFLLLRILAFRIRTPATP